MMGVSFDSSAHVKSLRCLTQTPEITMRDSVITRSETRMPQTTATLCSSIKRINHPLQPRGRSDDPRDSVSGQIGPMRAYARALAVNHEAADMFVKIALLASCKEIDSVEPGTDLRTWLFSNLHCAFHLAPRQPDVRSAIDTMSVYEPHPEGLITPREFDTAFASLPVAQREALFLTVAARLSFDDAATVCRCSAITLKRHAIEGRTSLAIALSATLVASDGRDEGDGSRLPRMTGSE